MSFELRWHGPRIKREIRKEMAARLPDLADMIVEKMRDNISTPFPPASFPGDFPHTRSSELIEGISHKTDKRKLSVRIFSSAPHSEFLENGTINMEPRPFIDRTLKEVRADARRYLVRGLGQKKGFCRGLS